MNYVLQEYMELSNNDIFGDKRLVKRLRAECRAAKEALSFDVPSYEIHVSIIKIIEVENYKIQLDIGSDCHLDLDVQLTKIKFNELCEELYTRTSKLIDDTIKMANLRTDEIDHVVNNHANPFILIENIFLKVFIQIMVGGSTRIPAIRNILEMKFGKEKLKFNINPDEAVVFGAAILADAIEVEIIILRISK